MNNFQREGAISNAHVGKDFEEIAMRCLQSIGYNVRTNYSVAIGINSKKKHFFDLGGSDENGNEVVVECKSHKWTSGKNVPSAKLTVWNEAMLYFSLLPENTKKILFVLKDHSQERNETLAEYYIRTYRHLIPNGVVIMEYDDNESVAKTIYES